MMMTTTSRKTAFLRKSAAERLGHGPHKVTSRYVTYTKPGVGIVTEKVYTTRPA